MNTFSLDRWKAYLLAQARQYQAAPSVQRPVVTISRETGAAALTIGQMVTDSFRSLDKGEPGTWALFDQNIVKAFLEDQDLPERLEEFILEDGKAPLEDAFEELLGLHPSTPALVQSMTRTILKLAKAGGVVLIGRGSHIICAKLSHAFHVRLVAPLDARVRHIAEYFRFTEREAGQYVEKMDRARKRYVRRYFGADVEDPHSYHLVINTGRLGYKEAANLIVDAASRHCGTK